MRRRNLAVVCIAGAVGALALWYALRGPASSHASPHASVGSAGTASAALGQWTRSSPAGSVLDLRTLDSRPWDSYLVFAPYTTHAEIDEALGFHWPQASQSGIINNDGCSLIVFVRGRVVVMAFDHPRDQGDFAYGRFAHEHFTDGLVRLSVVAGWPRLEPASTPRTQPD